jgi:hypothetical protein
MSVLSAPKKKNQVPYFFNQKKHSVDNPRGSTSLLKSNSTTNSVLQQSLESLHSRTKSSGNVKKHPRNLGISNNLYILNNSHHR